jgi:hypothetical protein
MIERQDLLKRWSRRRPRIGALYWSSTAPFGTAEDLVWPEV